MLFQLQIIRLGLALGCQKSPRHHTVTKISKEGSWQYFQRRTSNHLESNREQEL